MKRQLSGVIVAGLLAAGLVVGAAADPTSSTAARIDVPKYTSKGELIFPDGVDKWVMMGASLGMGYNKQDFDAKSPGDFVVVTLEPQAYAYFKQHGHFANGTMFAHIPYPAVQRMSTNRTGYVMGDQTSIEFHVVDRERFKDGFNFAVFAPGAKQAAFLPDGNGCVTCHRQNGAFENVFAQFYPTIRYQIPKEALAASLKKADDKSDIAK